MIDHEKIEQAVRLLLEGIGEDVNREGLLETPDRIARMYEEIYGGMEEDAGIHIYSRKRGNGHRKRYHFLFYLRTSSAPVLWKSSYCVYSGWKGSGTEQAGKNGRSIRKKTSVAGTTDRTDCRCTDGIYAAERCVGYDRGGAYVYDDAGNQKTGKSDGDAGTERCF